MPDALTLPEQLEVAARRFRETYHRPPRFAVTAPGRVNLIGEHTDYNDGFVLPMAIQRQAVLVADRAPGTRGRVLSVNQDASAYIEVTPPFAPGEPKWANYMRGVVAGCVQAGLRPGGFDAVLYSNVPIGGGLSSSAALEVATASLVEVLADRTLDPVAKALLCQQAEHTFAGVPCGIMDQFISVLGRENCALLLDCRTHQTRLVELADPKLAILIANTNVKHELVGGEYAQRRAQCEQAARTLGVPSLRDVSMKELVLRKGELDPVVYRRAFHVVGEIARTVQAADEIAGGFPVVFGRLMHKSHESLRDDYQVSCPELDVMVELAMELGLDGGVYGSRMTGGGFGGCTVSLVKAERIDAVADHLRRQYQARTGIEPTLFATRPAGGARVLELAPGPTGQEAVGP